MSLMFKILLLNLVILTSNKMCESNKRVSVDIRTPRNVSLSAFYKRSFGFHTVKNRYPVILTQIIDSMVRNKLEIVSEHGQKSYEELKETIGELSKLKYEIQTNKPLQPMTCTNCNDTFQSDIPFYNSCLEEENKRLGKPADWYNSKWLLNECYMHRRSRHFFEKTETLKNFDHYKFQKEQSFLMSQTQMLSTGTFLLQLLTTLKGKYDVKEKFFEILKLNLWGNKCDLSFSNGILDTNVTEHLSTLKKLDPFIVVDDSEKIWEAVSNNTSKSPIVDIVLDNSGYELFTDFCLGDFLISNNLAGKIRFYVKASPWYISDVTNSDYHWTLRQLGNSENAVLQELSQRWTQYTENKTFTIETHSFWTLPSGFTDMKKVDPELYRKLGEAKLTFFKGDLNYRKLVDDINWDATTPMTVALQEFRPGKLCSLRTVKSDVLCGLKEGVMEDIEKKTPNWAFTGDYGLIAFADSKSYAYYVIKDELPIILDIIIESLRGSDHQRRREKGENYQEDIKTAVYKLGQFKAAILENRPLQLLDGLRSDVKFYNEYLSRQTAKFGTITYFHAKLLHAESYFYRNVYEICENVLHDPFKHKKQEFVDSCMPQIILLSRYFLSEIVEKSDSYNVKEKFIQFLKMVLWSNRYVRQIKDDEEGSITNLWDVHIFDDNIICDHSEKVWALVASGSLAKSQIIDIVLDDGGYPCFTILCLADFIITHNLAKRVRFYVMCMPWYITKITLSDFFHFLLQLKNSDSEMLQQLGDRWFAYTGKDVWDVEEYQFWTLPTHYCRMEFIDPRLHDKLAEAKLLIFLGDLNYRKLFGDKNWNPVTPPSVAKRSFQPTSICALKILMSEVICGLEVGVAERLDKVDPLWQYNGNYGVIQLMEVY